MSNLDRDVQLALKKIFVQIVPPGMTAKERDQLARKAGISPETLRANIRRQTLNADTLIRLLLARGVSLKTLSQLPQTDLSELSAGESGWIELGQDLRESERIEFIGLIRYLRSKWKLV